MAQFMPLIIADKGQALRISNPSIELAGKFSTSILPFAIVLNDFRNFYHLFGPISIVHTVIPYCPHLVLSSTITCVKYILKQYFF